MDNDQSVLIGTRFTHWFEHATCRGASVDAFFEHRLVGGRPAQGAYRTAREFCAACPVISSCRREADARDEVGLWGGQWRPAGKDVRPVDLLARPASAHPGRQRLRDRSSGWDRVG